MSDDPTQRKDALKWKWSAGPVAKEDFGDPTAGTGYTLCVFDASGAAIAGIQMESDGDCADRSCWKATSRGFRLKDARQGQQGKSALKASLRDGTGSRPAKLIVRSKGPATGLDAFGAGLAQPVSVQLITDDQCWGAVFEAPAARNSGGRFKDKMP
jgi:hypothetical protein